jgi:starvation-inducible outer membrane lipoprotein
MKKNRFYFLAMAVLVLSFTLVLGSCGADPKGLAKQSYELTQQALTVGTDLQKAAELQKKVAAIAEKVEKLSASDQATYTQELARLVSGGR